MLTHLFLQSVADAISVVVLDASDKGFDWGNSGANMNWVMGGEIEGAFVGVWFEVSINWDRKVKYSGAAAPAVSFIPLFILSWWKSTRLTTLRSTILF